MTQPSRHDSWLESKPNVALGKRLRVVVWIVTAVVWMVVIAMRRPEKLPLPEGVSLGFLPGVHAVLNSLVAICLVAALVQVKRGNILWHRRLMSMALVLSALFLLGYVAYHFTTPETRYGGTGAWKIVYLVLLITHIVLAALSFPWILQTWVYSWTGQFDRHRRLAKWVYPAWLFVSVTGPICYWMLRPYYG